MNESRSDFWQEFNPTRCDVCGREACEDHIPDPVTIARGPIADATEILTEARAAERFANRYADEVRFDHRRARWLRWNGHRWATNTDGEITRQAIAFAREWQHEAVSIRDLDARAKVQKHVIRLEQRDGLANMLRFARDFKPIADAGETWDANPWLLGVPNGVIDLRIGTLRAGRRDDRITMAVGVPFDPEAPCPRFDRFVREVSAGNEALAVFQQRHCGYCLTASVVEQTIHVWNGRGANGKSTFAKILLHVLGEYGDTAAFSTFERSAVRGAIPNDLAALAGKRLIIASETREGARLDEGRLKSISGGDRLRARFLNHEWFSFDPTFKLILCVNHRPVISDDSFGFWRRVRLVPFGATFNPDPALDEALRAEAPGILAWAVRGCLDWQRNGLAPPPIVDTATADYKTESDQIADFLGEACVDDAAAEVRAAEFFDHYRQWADRHKLTERERLTATAFGIKMAERYRKTKTKQGAVYEGVRRLDNDDPAPVEVTGLDQ